MTRISQHQPFRMIFVLFVALAALITASATAGPVLSARQDKPNGLIASPIGETYSVDFDRWPYGRYTSEKASADFGNVSGWDADRTIISGGRLRAELEPNKIGGDGGTLARVNIVTSTEYEMQYTVNFHSQFDWGRGGKLGWGFAFGDGAGGCTRADGDGASLRLMWYTDDSGRTYFRPYLYYADMPKTCGDSFGRSYPSMEESLQVSTDYVIYIYVRSNTGNNKDGWAVIKVNGITLLDIPIQWTDNNAKRSIRNLVFHTFRGGSQDYWASDRVGFIYYDNFSISRFG